ncbi:MAG: UDP-N-acetylglucosamine--N-acetylmuramyl-(pentapeptide) pyrophosphoryl-undecaprenol N-acetylglucosamine transferase, partial [Pseudomonadota bacterium]
KPNMILGMGGFVAGPGGLAAFLTRTPLVVHEQNAVAGLTNRYLAKFANRVLTGFKTVGDLNQRIEWVGNPIREDIMALHTKQPSLTQGVIKVLVLGGSQGAYSLNRYLPAQLTKLAEVIKAQQLDLRVIHQSGVTDQENVAKRYAEEGLPHTEVQAFIEDMAVALEWADLCICRAGAMTVSELCAARKPALLVPYPFSAGDHQDHNADVLVDHGAALKIDNAELNSPKLLDSLEAMLSTPDQLLSMGERAAQLYKANALHNVVSVCEEYLHA